MSASATGISEHKATTATTSNSLTTEPAMWLALLWKDWCQIWPALLAINVGFAMLQAIILVSVVTLLPRASWSGMTEAIAGLAWISPVLVALASAGMLIGHERQTRTWDWCSSLPISWRTALFSKLIVTLVATGGTLFWLGLLPLLSIAYIAQPPANGWMTSFYASALTFFLAVDAMVFFSLSVLLFRDTLNGLLWGAVWILVLQVLLVTIPLRLVALLGLERLPDRLPDWILGSELAVVLWLGFVGLVFMFRWRWGVGQSASLSPFSAKPLAWTGNSGVLPSKGRPTEWRMLFWLSLGNSFGKRLAIVTLVAVCLAFEWWKEPLAFAACGLIACLLFGITAFEADQTEGRYRFLADRGVSSNRLIISRLWLPLLFTAAMAILALVFFVMAAPLPVPSESDQWVLAWIGFVLTAGYLTANLAGAFAALCFDKPIISAVVAFVTAALATYLYVALFQAEIWIDPHPYWLGSNSLVVFLLVSPPVLALAISRCAHSWLVNYRVHLGRVYLGVVLTLVLLPVLLVAHLGFLILPQVAWRGLPPEQWSRGTVPMPDLSEIPDPLLGKAGSFPKGSNLVSESHVNAIWSGLQEQLFEQTAEQPPSLGQGSEQSFAATELVEGFAEQGGQALDALEQALDGATEEVAAATAARWLNDLLMSTALAAIVYTQADEQEVAGQSLRLHGRVRRLAIDHCATETIQTRIATMRLFVRHFNREMISALGDGDELLQWLLPDLSNTRDQFIQLAQVRASFERALLFNEPLPELQSLMSEWPGIRREATALIETNYPPLRWRAERAISLGLDEALETIQLNWSGQPPDYWQQLWTNRYLHEYLMQTQQLIPERQKLQ